MNEHFISLPENVYCHLLAIAETQGMTPADWIASQLPPNADQQNSLASSLSGLIGSINSQVEPSPSYEKTVFGEAIASKLAKQGIRQP
ncbi:hypothetical protein [Tolypothrix sp. VBCCA 56010]|uniref:hypothetical protein n=1 Tax=Tolypothrix sp. VBCCA 56010 TaxID=3137731 RepID=UPI003D7F08B8